MRKNRMSVVTGLVIACSLLTGGCIDAVGAGIADGISSGLSAVVQAFIESALGGLGGGTQ